MRIRKKALTRAIAFGRIGLGSVFGLAPGLGLRAWPGGGAGDDVVARLLSRSVGGRDLAIGIGTLMALRHDGPVRGWLEAGIVADAADAVAIVAAFGHLPRMRSLVMLSLAAGAAVAGRLLVGALEPE
ncbi:MAG: hypothetical protein ACRD0Q_05490 [Acidimicrobiales bacterium]